MKLVKAREAEFKFNTGPEVLTITLEGIVVDDLTAKLLESRVPVIVEEIWGGTPVEESIVDAASEELEVPEETPVEVPKKKTNKK